MYIHVVPRLPHNCRTWTVVTGGRSGIGYSNKGFLGREGHKRPYSRDDGAPIAKKRWGGNQRGAGNQQRAGSYRGNYRR